MIRSMTGFGAATGRMGAQRVSVELRTVNHRFFNPNIKLPPSLARFEGDVREWLRAAIGRGHVGFTARTEHDAAQQTPAVDEARFAGYVALMRGLQQRHGLSPELDVGTVLRLPDVLTAETADDSGSVAELETIVRQALAAHAAMSEAEGARLAVLLEERIALVEQALDRIAARAPERLTAERDRLRRAVRELSEGIDLDPQRVAQEIAVCADRLDVSEEIDRFRSHVHEFRATLRRETGEQVGKRLSFLLQEMLREANTTGSKSRDAAMTHDVVAVKEELERIAEQVENVR